jgi:hypothetical protein
VSARSVAPKAAAEVSLALVGVSALIRGQHGIDANLFLRARRRRRRPPMWRKRYSLLSVVFSRARSARAVGLVLRVLKSVERIPGASFQKPTSQPEPTPNLKSRIISQG